MTAFIILTIVTAWVLFGIILWLLVRVQRLERRK